MTKTITIPQSTIDSLSAGTYTLKIEATANGFSSSQSTEFVTWNKPSIMIPTLGEYNTAFSFDLVIGGINGSATVIGLLDGSEFYRLNYAKDGTFTILVKESTVLALNGGSHTISFSLEDKQRKTASASTTFVKTMTVPIVAVPSNVGDKLNAFSVSYTIKNVQTEHPSLNAYMDTESNLIVSLPDAAITNSITIDNSIFDALEEGSHTIIIKVENDEGVTTKTVAFNKTVETEDAINLKLAYNDDTWDGSIVENRIFSETDVSYQGNAYKSFVDETPYDTEGEPVTGNMLASFSRGILNALASNVVRNSDGSYTEKSSSGVSTLTETDNGYTEVYTDKDGNTLTKNVFFNPDGSISESTSLTRS